VLGAVLHLAIQLPGLAKLPERSFLPTLGLDSPSVREVGRLIAPRLLGVGVVQLNLVVNVIIATGLPVGSLAAIRNAWMVMTMPQVVIAQAIAIAALPTFSAQAARGATGEMRTSLAATLRGVLFLSLPASLGLILLRRPLIMLLFQHGEFDARSTELVAWALLWYAAGLIGHNLVEILSRAFYALHDTRTPVVVGAAAMTLKAVLRIAFARLFTAVGWMPHGGLALANSLATALEMAALLYLMRRRLKGLDGTRVARGGLQAALATACMGAAIWVGSGISMPIWLLALGGVGLGALVYFLVIWLLRVPELDTILAGVSRRLRRAG
jgi:putative peptidoglycan lipid II flippase